MPSFRVDPVHAALFSRFRANAWLILAAAVVLLLLACAKLGEPSAGARRSREYDAAIHASLGAGRSRLIGNALLESVLVCSAGAAVALIVVSHHGESAGHVLPPLPSRYSAGPTDSRVLAITLLDASPAQWLPDSLPAWRASRVDVLSVLQSVSTGRQRSRLRGGRGLVVVESALAVLLVLSGSCCSEVSRIFPPRIWALIRMAFTRVPAAALAGRPLSRGAASHEQSNRLLISLGVEDPSAGWSDTTVCPARPRCAAFRRTDQSGVAATRSVRATSKRWTPFIAGRGSPKLKSSPCAGRDPQPSAARIFFRGFPPAQIVGTCGCDR